MINIYNTIKNIEINSHINGQLIFIKDTKSVKGKEILFWSVMLEQINTDVNDTYVQYEKYWPSFTPGTQLTQSTSETSIEKLNNVGFYTNLRKIFTILK